MATKLIMRWDIQPGAESEYFEYMVSEFIPGVKRLGIDSPQVWYTAYGNTEQILVSGITDTEDHMRHILSSREWQRLQDGLDKLVSNFSQRVIQATSGFQL